MSNIYHILNAGTTNFGMNSKSITCYSYSTKNLVVFNVSRNLELQNI